MVYIAPVPVFMGTVLMDTKKYFYEDSTEQQQFANFQKCFLLSIVDNAIHTEIHIMQH